jgi:adenylate cyclase
MNRPPAPISRQTEEKTMSQREFYYRWEWDLQASPQQLWPLVSDTNRFNRDIGLAAITDQQAEGDERFNNGRRRLQVSFYGVPVAWLEEPFEWIQPCRFGVVRRYERGLLQPLKEMRTLTQLEERPDGGTHLTYEAWVQPSGWLGRLAIPVQLGWIFAPRFAATFAQYDQLALAEKVVLDLPTQPGRLAPGGQERLDNLHQALVAQGAAPALVERLVHLVEQADDLTVQKIRPYALADQWGVSRREMLELSLLATRLGLLDFQWDLLCPLCRGAKNSAPNLSDITQVVHCDTCHIDYTANFERSVELTFRPNPAVRLLDDYVEFCMAGPQATPHIAVQQLLPPGEWRLVTPRLEPGRYRLRTLKLPGSQYAQVHHDGRPEVTLRARPAGWPNDEPHLLPNLNLTLANETDEEQLFILERTAWADQAATAAEVTTLQRFRDLFSDEALRPGEQISVGHLTILFTDLRDSTRMYREIGDAPAFGLVMNHFDVLRAAIAAEDGAIVKTIGDAVMAVFRRPVSALRAMFAAQAELAHPLPGQRPLLLKAALHSGPCIAVTLNDRLDYFGSTVNVAARLEKFAGGGDVIISDAVHDDPEVRDFLSEQESKLRAESFREMLKGFDDETFVLWRVKMEPQQVQAAAPGH